MEIVTFFSREKGFGNILYVKCYLLTTDVIDGSFSKPEIDFWSSQYEAEN